MILGPGIPPTALPAPAGGADAWIVLVVVVAVAIAGLAAILARRTGGDSPQAETEVRQLERLGA